MTPPTAGRGRAGHPADVNEDERHSRCRHRVFPQTDRQAEDHIGVLPEDAQEEIAPLLDAHLMMLGKSRLIRGARKRIESEHLGAETAVLDESEDIRAVILAAKDDDKAGLSRRANEIRDIARRLIRNLTATPFRSFKDLPEGCILVAEELTPAIALLDRPASPAWRPRKAGRIIQPSCCALSASGGARRPWADRSRRTRDQVVLGRHGLVSPHRRRAGDRQTGWPPSPERTASGSSPAGRDHRWRDGRMQANLEIPQVPLIAQAGAMGIGLRANSCS
jgi:phosphotransferase system enzyme I (PtsI)